MSAATESVAQPVGPQGEPDPTLVQLIPQPTPWRWVALSVAVVVLLVGAWFSPLLIRPSVQPQQAGMWGPISKSSQLVTITSIKVEGWPKPRIEAVREMPGASVEGAWLVEDDGQNLGYWPSFDAQNDLSEQLTGWELIEAAEPPGIFGETTQLPQTVKSNVPLNLVVLWNVNNCAALNPNNPIIVDISTSLTRVVGSSRRVSLVGNLDSVMAPGHDIDTLGETGTCP